MRNRIRRLVFAGITGVILSFCLVAGYYLDSFDSLDLLSGEFYWKFFLGALLLWAAVWGGFEALPVFWKRYVKKPVGGTQKKAAGKLLQALEGLRLPYVLCVAVMLLCWLPALLSIFPGAFSYDAYEEWTQVRDGMITSHHPVLHVLLLGGLVEGFYSLTGSYNVGIAVYSVLQMLLLSNAFALSIFFQKKFRLSGVWQLFSLIFYCASPVIQLFSICATKDVLFTAAQLMFLQMVILFYCKREEFFSKKSLLAAFGIFTFFTMTLRNNGLYIALIICICMLAACRKEKREYRIKLALVFAGILAAYGLYTGPFYSILSVKPGGVEEMLSVPIQQMARVYRYDYDTLGEEELELLYAVLPQENLEAYRPTVSDFVKAGFQEEVFSENRMAYLRLWAEWGLKHPLTYVNSFLVNTVDFWYPFAVIDGYRDAYGKSSYFDYMVDRPGEEVVLLKGFHRYYEAISHDKAVQKNGWSFLFLSPGWLLSLFWIFFLRIWCEKQYRLMVPLLVFLLTLLTALLGPIALVRYVLIFFFGFPTLLALFFKRNEKNLTA